jgi:hypothetical protein
MAKMIVYGEDARKKLQAGIDQLANRSSRPVLTSWPTPLRSLWDPRAATWFWARSTALP